MTDRTLTISRLHPISSYREKHRTLPRTREHAPVPFLRLSGQWLEAAGFEIGSKVQVKVKADRLVVEPADA